MHSIKNKAVAATLITTMLFSLAACSSKTEEKEKTLLIFPEEPYNSSIVHPEKTPGKVTGQEALDTLNQVEKDYLSFLLKDDYFASQYNFRDYEWIGVEEISWGKVGVGDYEADYNTMTDLLETLYTLDYESFEEEDRVFYERIIFDLEEDRYMKQYPGFTYMAPAVSVSHIGGLYALMANVDLDSKERIDNYLKLLEDFDRYFDDVIVFEKERADLGYGSIETYYSELIKVLYSMTSNESVNGLNDSFNERISALSALSSEEKQSYIDENDRLMKEVVVPEIEEYMTAMKDIKECAVNKGGLCGFEHGDELYAHYLRSAIGADADPMEVAAALDEIISTDLSNVKSPNIKGNDSQEVLSNIKELMGDYFPELDIQYEILPLPTMMKMAGVGGAYTTGYVDVTDNEKIYLNKGYPSTITVHEGMPGHMYQFSYHKNICKHPYMIVYASDTYCEGWATYIMFNPTQMYGTSDNDDILYVDNDQLVKYIGARVDIAINYEGKSDSEAMDHIRSLINDPSKVPGISCDMIKYQPAGGYLCYGVGSYYTCKTLDEIRKLDPSLSLKELHTIYLNACPAPFDLILESAKRQLGK